MVISIPPVNHSCDIVEQARERLQSVRTSAFRDLWCEYRDGRLVLQGRVESYYEKQLAQEAVAGLEGVAQVVNQLEVVWSNSNLQWRSVQ